MTENEPGELADEREREAQKLERLSEQLRDEVNTVREDWRRKRADPAVPGAVPEDDRSDEEARESPAPEAPPEGAGPAGADTPAEGSAGPPADAP